MTDLKHLGLAKEVAPSIERQIGTVILMAVGLISLCFLAAI